MAEAIMYGHMLMWRKNREQDGKNQLTEKADNLH